MNKGVEKCKKLGFTEKEGMYVRMTHIVVMKILKSKTGEIKNTNLCIK
ncbi:hypothetical protein C8R11_11080 [Nitrosomonas aestuarii]|nr:hypothetical protein C8R11_11080 [Nitrosomonas aestuarii]